MAFPPPVYDTPYVCYKTMDELLVSIQRVTRVSFNDETMKVDTDLTDLYLTSDFEWTPDPDQAVVFRSHQAAGAAVDRLHEPYTYDVRDTIPVSIQVTVDAAVWHMNYWVSRHEKQHMGHAVNRVFNRITRQMEDDGVIKVRE